MEGIIIDRGEAGNTNLIKPRVISEVIDAVDADNFVKSFIQEYGKKKDFYNKINQDVIHLLQGGSIITDDIGHENSASLVKLFDHLKKEVSLWHPAMDGICHINVYSKGGTQLGRMLSNFFWAPIVTKDHGEFASIEGYWYWLKKPDDKLRKLYGYTAKKFGKDISKGAESHYSKADFENLIKEAIEIKIETHANIRQSLIGSDLPLQHYYYYGKIPNVKIYKLEEYAWITDHIAELRHRYQEELKDDRQLTQRPLPEGGRYGDSIEF